MVGKYLCIIKPKILGNIENKVALVIFTILDYRRLP